MTKESTAELIAKASKLIEEARRILEDVEDKLDQRLKKLQAKPVGD